MDEFLKAKFDAYRAQGRVKVGAPKLPGRNILIFCTYSGQHTGINEAVPAGKYAGQFFEHLGFNVLDEWYLVGEYHGSEEASTRGRLGDIRGRPNAADLTKVKQDVTHLLQRLSPMAGQTFEHPRQGSEALEGGRKMFEVSTQDAPLPAGHYAQAVVHNGLVFVSGQLPVDPQTGEKRVGSIEDQTEQVLNNLAAILRAAGSDLDQVLKTTVYISDIGLWDRFNAVYAQFFGQHRPARAVVPTKALHFGFQVEIEAVAVVKPQP